MFGLSGVYYNAAACAPLFGPTSFIIHGLPAPCFCTTLGCLSYGVYESCSGLLTNGQPFYYHLVMTSSVGYGITYCTVLNASPVTTAGGLSVGYPVWFSYAASNSGSVAPCYNYEPMTCLNATGVSSVYLGDFTTTVAWSSNGTFQKAWFADTITPSVALNWRAQGGFCYRTPWLVTANVPACGSVSQVQTDNVITTINNGGRTICPTATYQLSEMYYCYGTALRRHQGVPGEVRGPGAVHDGAAQLPHRVPCECVARRGRRRGRRRAGRGQCGRRGRRGGRRRQGQPGR